MSKNRQSFIQEFYLRWDEKITFILCGMFLSIFKRFKESYRTFNSISTKLIFHVVEYSLAVYWTMNNISKTDMHLNTHVHYIDKLADI